MEFLLIDGLKLYQSIILYLGCIVAFIGIISLIKSIFSSTPPIWQSILILIISVIFIGWTSIKSISFSKDMISIEKWEQELLQDPDNTDARDNLEAAISNIDADLIHSAKNLTKLAELSTLLGNYEEGVRYSEKAIARKEDYSSAREVKDLAETGIEIKQLRSDSSDQNSVINLRIQMNELETRQSNNPLHSLIMERGFTVTGDQEKARNYRDSTISRSKSIRH